MEVTTFLTLWSTMSRKMKIIICQIFRHQFMIQVPYFPIRAEKCTLNRSHTRICAYVSVALVFNQIDWSKNIPAFLFVVYTYYWHVNTWNRMCFLVGQNKTVARCHGKFSATERVSLNRGLSHPCRRRKFLAGVSVETRTSKYGISSM
jgi:hypothetical protein